MVPLQTGPENIFNSILYIYILSSINKLNLNILKYCTTCLLFGFYCGKLIDKKYTCSVAGDE